MDIRNIRKRLGDLTVEEIGVRRVASNCVEINFSGPQWQMGYYVQFAADVLEHLGASGGGVGADGGMTLVYNK